MVDLIVRDTPTLKGTIEAPPSKAISHRAFIAATLSPGLSIIRKPLICDDILATIDACRTLGAKIIRKNKEVFEVHGCYKILTPEDVVNCRDSASTMRFLTPICGLTDGISVLTGDKSLRKRPMGPLLDAMRQLGIQCYSTRGDGRPPIIVFGGGIEGGETCIPGDVSSQFVSGLLFAAPMARNDVEIEMLTPLESKPYVEITIDVLCSHGIQVEVNSEYKRFRVPCGQTYTPSSHVVEGDYSSAAFLLAAASITDSKIRVTNLREDSLQGDRIIVDLLRKIGVEVKTGKNFVEVNGRDGSLQPFNVDLRDNPDLVPVCTALAFFARGESLIRGIRRLRFKESDRIAALLSEFTKMKGKIHVGNDMIKLEGGEKLRGAELSSHGDHRIAMALIISALGAKGTSIIRGVECINKSYPNFLNDMKFIGANIVERKLDR